MVITRFAPSPTGDLHIGGARTALFNYLFAKHHNGKFLLRIEDTDLERSKQKYYESILSSLNWLGIKYDEEIVFQSKNTKRYLEVVNNMLKNRTAYKCFLTQEEIDEQRSKAEKNKQQFSLNSKWRDAGPQDYPENKPFSIRLKAPKNQDIIIKDVVQGEVIINSSEVDDQVLVRSNGAPTYMLAVVVDDHDMGITHIIRGDDHLVNTPKQILIYHSNSWQVPIMHHIPLIHGPDGSKLSKRHGATNVIEYQDKYLPSSLTNYFLNLGWYSEKAHDIMTQKEQIEIFTASGFRKASSRIDFDKLININQKHINLLSSFDLIEYIKKHFSNTIDLVNNSQDQNISNFNQDIDINFQNMQNKISINLTNTNIKNIKLAQKSILSRSKTLLDIASIAQIYTNEFISNINLKLNDLQKDIIQNIILNIDEIYNFNAKEDEELTNFDQVINKTNIQMIDQNSNINPNTIKEEKINTNITKEEKDLELLQIKKTHIESYFKNYAKINQLKLSDIMLAVRLCLVGQENSPSVFELLAIIGKEITLMRLKNCL